MSRETLALWATVAVCAAIAIFDPATRFKGWLRSRRRARHAAGRGKPGAHAPVPGDRNHLNVERVEGAAPAVVAPSTAALSCGCEVLVDHPIPVTDSLVLGHYLSRAAKAPLVRA